MIEAGRAGGLAQAIRGLVAFVAVFVLTVSAVSAQDPYVVERVPVDVTAANASEARDRALDEAYGKAFDILVERLGRSEEHTSELQSLMRISYAVFCLKKTKTKTTRHQTPNDKTPYK